MSNMESKKPSGEGSGDTDSAEAGEVRLVPLPTLQIIWGALLVSLGMYAGISYVVAKPVAPADLPAPVPTMQMLFAMLSLGSLTVAYLLPRKLLQKAIGKEDPATLQIEKLVGLAFTPWILRMALTESVGIYGLMLAMVSGQPSNGLPFLIMSALVMLTHMPSEKALRSAAQPS